LSVDKQTTQKDSTMKTATAYIRVSTEGQVTDGVSLDAQRAKIEAWCFANDITLGAVFVDAGISGKRADNRPQLQAALDTVCNDGGVLVVYSLSRLARSTKDTIVISERLDKAGADLVSLSEKLDTTSAAGKMVFRMMAVLAEFERDQVSERTCSAMAHKKAQGQRVGTVPFGYDLAADGITLVENENETRIIELINSLRTKGYTLRAIAAEMDAAGFATKKGAEKWNHKTVANILKRSKAA
jgi:DNA invertase Pin-like site-specific DNA recombinase